MAVDFTKYSNYLSTAGISSVVFGANADVLETEVNELQQIQNEKSRRLIRTLFGDGILNADAITYSTGSVRLNNTYAFVDGYMVSITPSGLAYAISTGTVKLAVWEAEVQGTNDTVPSTLKLEGNEQEASYVANQITDSRTGTAVTSRRRILKYDLILSTDTRPNAVYLTVATVSSGVITSKCAQVSHSFAGSAKNITSGEDLNNYTRSGFYVVNASTANQPSGFGGGFLLITSASTGQALQEIFKFDGTKLMTRTYNSGWTVWRTTWTSGTMGAGSTLDADLLDGQHGSFYAPLASPTFTGVVSLPAATSIGNVSATELSYLDGVTSAIQTQLNAKAPLASPALTGTPTAPTAAVGTDTTQIATTAFVNAKIANDAPKKSASTGTVVNFIWSGTQAQYDAIGTKDANTLYFVVG